MQLLAAEADANADPAPGFGQTALETACAGGFPDVAKNSLDAGADARDACSLRAAIYNNYADIVDMLIARGADVNAFCWDGTPSCPCTPLETAVDRGNLLMVSKLLAGGAHVKGWAADGQVVGFNTNHKGVRNLLRDAGIGKATNEWFEI